MTAGPAGTVGTVHTFKVSTDLANDTESTLNIACDIVSRTVKAIKNAKS
jgi:hypothetical protein